MCFDFRRWSQGLLFHQAMVDCARAAILLPLGSSILNCQPVNKCSLVETAFLLLVTVSTVNMLTTVLNDSPVFPESDEEADLTAPLLMDSPQVKKCRNFSRKYQFFYLQFFRKCADRVKKGTLFDFLSSKVFKISTILKIWLCFSWNCNQNAIKKCKGSLVFFSLCTNLKKKK